MSNKYKIDDSDTEEVDEINIINNDYDHCIFIIAQLWLTSQLEKYSGSTGHRDSWYMYQQRNFQ